MKLPVMGLLVFLACAAARSEESVRFVFFILDSNFVLMKKTEMVIQSQGPSDLAEVKALVGNYNQVSEAPVGRVWQSYRSPADMGDVKFISDTKPPQTILWVGIDAMCGSCGGIAGLNGKIEDAMGTHATLSNLEIVPLEGVHFKGRPLDSIGKERLKSTLKDSGFSLSANKTIRINALKMPTFIHGSPNQIGYIAYFSEPEAMTGLISKTFPITPSGNGIPFDALGRNLLSFPSPAHSIPLHKRPALPP